MKTVRLTMAQALVRFLDNQYVSRDGVEEKFFGGVIGIFGHGIVVGLGEALEAKDHSLRFIQGKSEQGMAHIAMGYAKQKKRRKAMAVASSIGPGALNMVTAAGTATANRIPVLFLLPMPMVPGSPIRYFSRLNRVTITTYLPMMRSNRSANTGIVSYARSS